MGAWRVFLKEHRRLALWLSAVALAVKARVPQVYMLPDTGGKTMTIDVPMAPDHAKAPDGAKQDGGCAYSSLGHAMTGGADPVVLLAAIAFLLALGFAPAAQPRIRRRAFAQPPAQGPPALT